MEILWFWLVMMLLLFAVLALPTWPYTYDRWVYRRGGRWRYAPSGAAAGMALLILLLFWLGIVAMAWPWAAPPPPPPPIVVD